MLIIDDRERNVFDHLKELTVPYIIKRITVGDYALVDDQNRLLAVFERKSYVDFAASIRDGRHNNKNNLIRAREQTNCDIYYIVEGDAFPKTDKKYSKMPYIYIESAIDHLMIRDKIQIIYTHDIMHTLQRLNRFIKSFENLDNAIKQKIIENNKSADILNEPAVDGGDGRTGGDGCTGGDGGKEEVVPIIIPPPQEPQVVMPIIIPNADEVLQYREVKTDESILFEMWASIKGISLTTAPLFAEQFTIADIAQSKISKDILSNFKYANGRKIPGKLVEELSNLKPPTERRILSAVPGISYATATELIVVGKNGRRLANIATCSVNILELAEYGTNQRSIGRTKAESIIKFMNMKHGAV